MRFEVTRLPVGDVDRAKAFYQRLGWRLDIDFKPTPEDPGAAVHPAGLALFDPVREGPGERDNGAAGRG